jgi:phage baseplate assembly protein W
MAERFINIAFPFEDDKEKNYFLKMNREGKRAIKSDLLHLLLTTPGDRLYLPEFGADLRRYIFEPNDSETQGAIRSEIQQAIDKYIPNLKLTELKIENPNQGEFDVREEHAAVVRIDYIFTEGALTKADFIEITI